MFRYQRLDRFFLVLSPRRRIDQKKGELSFVGEFASCWYNHKFTLRTDFLRTIDLKPARCVFLMFHPGIVHQIYLNHRHTEHHATDRARIQKEWLHKLWNLSNLLSKLVGYIDVRWNIIEASLVLIDKLMKAGLNVSLKDQCQSLQHGKNCSSYSANEEV